MDPFVPSAAFVGTHAGYYFAMGPKGLGYYKDAPAPGEHRLPKQSASLCARQCRWEMKVCVDMVEKSQNPSRLQQISAVWQKRY